MKSTDVEYAEYLVEAARQMPEALVNPAVTISTKSKSIHQRLTDLYIEECKKQTDQKELQCNSYLLSKLAKKETLNTLVLNLYPANDGYSLMLRGRNGLESETIKLPYEEAELLEYIDAGELCPILVDLLERAQVNVFYSGCVIVEVRDFRRSTSGQYDAQFVLLKPTTQSLQCDINAIANDGHRWTQDDLFHLESQLLLATQEPLCLDPSAAVLLVANKLQYESKKFNVTPLKKSVKKFTQAAVNRKRKFAQAAGPEELNLHNYLARKKDKPRSNPTVNLKLGKSCVDMWKQKNVHLSVPEVIDVEKLAKAEKPKMSDDNNPILCEEYVLESKLPQGRLYQCKLSILQRPSDNFYLGDLYIDHDYPEKRSKGVSTRFTLETRANVDRYLKQFQESFTEEGQPVKITRQYPGCTPEIILETTTATPTTGTTTQALVSKATGVASTIAGSSQIDSSIVSASAKLVNKPIQVSLSIGSTGNLNASANLISPPLSLPSPNDAPTLQSPVALNQIAVNLHQAPQPSSQGHQTSQRARQTGHHGNLARLNSIPSPVSTTSVSQLPTYSQALASQHNGKKQTATPTPSQTARPTTLTSNTRRSSNANERITLTQTPQGLQTTTYLQAMSSSTASAGHLATISAEGVTSSPALGQTNIAPNINIANISGLSNLNIQGLTGLQGLTGRQGLQNIHMSLTMPGSGIAVPVPISMINTQTPLNQQGIILNSLPNQGNVGTLTVTSPSPTPSAMTSGQQATTSIPTTLQQTYVTMVTGLQATTSTSTTVTTSAGVLTSPTSVLQSHSGMISLPISLAGNLTQFLPGQQSLPLLQVSNLQGQQSIQLLNLQQQRAPLSAGVNQQPSSARQSSTAPPITTTVLSPQTLSGHQMAALSQISVGKQGQAGSTTLTPQQLMQLSYQPQPLQFQQLPTVQMKQPTATAASHSSSKSKSKKRATPTPPKT